MGQAKFDDIVVQLTHALYVIGKLQTVEIGKAAAVNVMPGMFAIKNALEGKHHVIRVQLAGRGEPGGLLERDVATQVETVGRAVVQHFPAFCQFRHQTISIRVHIQQSVIQLGGKRINDQAAARFLWIEGVDLPTDAIDKTAVANISMHSRFRRSRSLTTQESSHHDQRR